MAKEEEIVRTDVDDFLDLVKRKKKISISEAAKEMGTGTETIQAWTDFLVEEKIVGTEYRFTTQYIYPVEEKDKGIDISYIGFDTKEEFIEKARRRNISDTQIKLLWLKYLNMYRETMKEVFYQKALAKKMDKKKIDELWKKYSEYLERT